MSEDRDIRVGARRTIHVSDRGIGIDGDLAAEPRIVQELVRMGYQRAHIPELLTWADDEILDEIERLPTVNLSLRDRRYLAAAIAEFRGPTPGSGLTRAQIVEATRLPRGRRPLTDDQVRADLDRALAALAAERGITQPTWDQLAGAHDGLGWEGMTVDGLRKRRKGHPIPFAEKAPHLTE